MTNHKTVALFFDPWQSDPAAKSGFLSRLWGRFKKGVHTRANPRSKDYMESLVQEFQPDALWVECNGPQDIEKNKETGARYILVYPDTIGFGFDQFEKKLIEIAGGVKNIEVVNGRRRRFALSEDALKDMRKKRFLEKTMLPEFGFMFVFLLVTPVLLLIDLVRGRV